VLDNFISLAALMTLFSGIIGGLWLAIIGEWVLAAIPLILAFGHRYILGVLMLPTAGFLSIIIRLNKRNNPLQYFFGYLSLLYTNVLIVGWCVLSFFFCLYQNMDSGNSMIPYVLISQGVALNPWVNSIAREMNNPFSNIAVHSAVFFWSLFLLSVLLRLETVGQILFYLFIFVQIILIPIINTYLGIEIEKN